MSSQPHEGSKLLDSREFPGSRPRWNARDDPLTGNRQEFGGAGAADSSMAASRGSIRADSRARRPSASAEIDDLRADGRVELERLRVDAAVLDDRVEAHARAVAEQVDDD